MKNTDIETLVVTIEMLARDIADRFVLLENAPGTPEQHARYAQRVGLVLTNFLCADQDMMDRRIHCATQSIKKLCWELDACIALRNTERVVSRAVDNTYGEGKKPQRKLHDAAQAQTRLKISALGDIMPAVLSINFPNFHAALLARLDQDWTSFRSSVEQREQIVLEKLGQDQTHPAPPSPSFKM